MKRYSVILLLLILILSSCSGNKGEEVAEVKVLPASNFKSLIENKDVMLIDVRTAGEYEQGFIEGAVNIDVKESGFESKIKHFDKDMPIAVYCARGGRSANAAEIFKKLGFKEVYDLEGGYNNWNK